ncbi:MAG: SDR family NAD(P)-dependent oxidoreductase [Erythrobacter sp.]|uniref:SDR family NAD(P)-dependent oxidoreductase n=1 Tax=Erythrobacter sp. TaxID=1042 RepID=UPI0025DBC391|nr:SDR family NAD(P)-dependent oxidoreductase [Erythrobacter sp.]MCL9998788.1 SDR family NAD(P)-dependent oxidoreductase [Erythrobacter sp.]
MRDFAGKTAVITGAASGIGAALATKAGALGMNLVLADVAADDARALAGTIAGVGTLVVHCDVSDETSVKALADAAFDRFGTIDLLCNNAGIVPGGRHRLVWEYTPGDWQWSLGVNLYGVIHGLRAFVPRMIAQGSPSHILNTASVAGFVSGSGSACYGAAKHAMVRVTEALYAGLRQVEAPIGVTMLCPGLVRTQIYEAERLRPAALADHDRPVESADLDAMRDDLYRHALGPDEAAVIAFDAIEEDRFYAFTTEAFDTAIRARADSILARTNPSFASIVEMSRMESDGRARQ